MDLTAVIDQIDSLVHQRMTEEGIPGLVLALTDRDGPLHTAAYGYANADAREPMTTSHLLETGSIGKSFTAIAILQLHEEGKIDLHAPIRNYLPWFEVQSQFDPPTIHHALSHTTGIIYGTDFSPDARYEVWALRETTTGSPPGTYFHYSNVVYKALGLILERLEGRPYDAIIRDRVLQPLGVNATTAAITHSTRRRMAQPHAPFYDDRPPHPQHGIVPATWLESNTSDGCLASSVGDLATYLRMFLNHGNGANDRVLSQSAFDQMTRVVARRETERSFSDYGYGIATSELNDSTVLHHDGGMVGYTSAMVGDQHAGLGAVAIVNGPGNPHDIAWHALELLQARFHQRALPAPIEPREPSRVENAPDYAGTFRSTDREGTISLSADSQRLLLERGGTRVTLEQRGRDSFFVPDDGARFLFRFVRNESGAVTEAMFGPDWFVNDHYDGPTSFDYPAEWDAYPGHYRSHNPWFSNLRIVLRQGKLATISGHGHEEPLSPMPDGSFRAGEDDRSPERYRFDTIIDGVTHRILHSGETYYRFFTP